jgi:hypothetical protein
LYRFLSAISFSIEAILLSFAGYISGILDVPLDRRVLLILSHLLLVVILISPQMILRYHPRLIHGKLRMLTMLDACAQ